MEIGSKYNQLREEFAEKIRTNSDEIRESNEERKGCYFCGQEIKEKMYVWTKREKLGRGNYTTESKFFADDVCFETAKNYFWFDDNIFGLN
ncbi:MAG: hypothetical protein Q7S33_02720 [Nanoarchaeota archaeon]|nr:hypothetical protein [Nanoarchaeota archaeon]